MSEAQHHRAPSARRARRQRAHVVLVGALLGGALAVSVPGRSDALPSTSSLDGTTPADAAASCWEIKQQHPSSTDGVYWLRTDSLERPAQFHCDMTTDGGGWVLIGRGREGWTFRDSGQLAPDEIHQNITGPAAFSPGALSTDTIDDLLDGGAVADLPDGIRIRRALDVNGTSWQEMRWEFLDLTSWSWAFGGGHRLSTWSIDGATGTGSNTKDSNRLMPGEVGDGNLDGNFENGWFTFPWSGHGGVAGFSYRGSIDGQNNGTSYLWEFANEDHAIPFTQLYLRPQVTTGTPAPIPDTGTIEQTLTPLLDDRPFELSGGVLGVRKVGDSEPAVDTPVQAFATVGDRVFVGGKFDDVRNGANGQLVDQNYLAAFDRATGLWIPSFTPQLDGTVWDLTVADGRLIVAGQFTNVDGAPRTAGLAALDPITGAVDPTWNASLSLSGSSQRPYVRGLDIADGWIHVGGNFTSITHRTSGGNDVVRNTGRLARVRVSDGFPDNQFLPNVDGTIYDVDANAGRVHLVGDFDGVNRASNASGPYADPVNNDKGVSTLVAATGEVVPGLLPAEYTTPNVSRQYQQAVHAVGAEVYQGGSEHNVHVYDAADYSLTRSWVTAGNGGDTQAFALVDGVMYQGSHGNSWLYTDAVTWPQLDGYSRVDDYKWVGAFDVASREYLPTWVPSLRSGNTEGAWALHADVDGCLWFGGDFIGGPFVGGQRQYLEGFSKFCPRDIVAPTVPTNAGSAPVDGGGVQITWSASTDDRPGFVGYEILRNDRVVSPLVYGQSYVDPSGGAEDRYFVRAVDPAGNRSASTPLLAPGDDNQPPSTPQNLTAVVLPDDSVDLSWDASTDDVGVDRYLVLRNGVELVVVPGDQTSVNLPDLGPGPHWLQVRAVDAAGNESFKTPPVRVDIGGPDTQRPTQPGSPAAEVDADGLITFSWTASSDDTAVTGYTVRRNLTEVMTVDADTLSVVLDLGEGTHYLQVEAFDAAGNVSFRTSPVMVVVTPGGGGDASPPSTPGSLVAVPGADGVSVDVSWSASSDDVGVEGYRVLRNLTEVAVVAGDVTSVNVPLGVGDHYIQVQAFDAAGNDSFRTSPVLVTLTGGGGGDVTPPSFPTNVVAVVEADQTITVTWTGSTDDVAVASYRVLRNLVEVDLVPAPVVTTNLDLGTGDHYIQIQAIDTSGNESGRTAPVLVSI